MTEIVDLSRIGELRSRREHYADIVQEGLRRKIEMMHDDAEDALSYARDASRTGRDLSDEFTAMESFANGLLLAVALMRKKPNG